jgi:hypothetical protein
MVPCAQWWWQSTAPAGDGGAAAPVDPRVEDLLRQLAPQVNGALVRRYGHFDACEAERTTGRPPVDLRPVQPGYAVMVSGSTGVLTARPAAGSSVA